MVWRFSDFSDRIALIDEEGHKLLYRELADNGTKLSAEIGDRCLVFSLCKNTIGSVVGYAAFVNNGIVPALLNSNLEHELLFELIEQYKPKYIWMPKEKKDVGDYEIVYELFDYVLVKTKFESLYEINDELALLLTTSGSTGSPKFVRQSYENIKVNAESIVEYLQIDKDEKPITTLPMNYTYGLSIINSHLLIGATILLTEKAITQKEFWQFFKNEEATSFGGVPFTYEMLDRFRCLRMELPSLRYMTQAGGKLSPELHRKMAEYAQKNNKKFVVMYGQCEATARMGYLPAEKALEKCGSMGIAIPGGKFHLIDVNGKEIEQAHFTGELVYEGANVTLGYAECVEDLAKGDERKGKLETGDMAQRDEEGFYYIVGRKKRFLKIFGNRVNLDEIDQLVKKEFNNIDFASSGIDDHMYLFVVDEQMKEPVREFVVKKTGLNPSAFTSVVIPEIPKTDAGKVKFKELDKYYKLEE